MATNDYYLRTRPTKRARKNNGLHKERDLTVYQPDVWTLRKIFSYCTWMDREAVFRVSKMWRANYLWVAPYVSYNRALHARNHSLANQIWSYNNELLRNQVLRGACHNGKIFHIKEMLVNNWLGARDFQTGIQYAIASSQATLLELFLQDARFSLNGDGVVAAAHAGNLQILQRLCADPRVDLAACAAKALLTAVFHSHAHIVAFLLLHVSAHDAQWAFLKTCTLGGLAVLEQFLQDRRVDPAFTQNKALVLASRHGHLNIVSHLLQLETVDPRARNQQALIDAAASNHVQVVDRLLSDDRIVADGRFLTSLCTIKSIPSLALALNHPRVDVTTEHHGFFIWACHYAPLDCFKLIVQHDKIDPAMYDNYALRTAVKNHDLPRLELVLQHARVDPSANNFFLFDFAVNCASKSRNYDLVARLCQEKKMQGHVEFPKYSLMLHDKRRKIKR